MTVSTITQQPPSTNTATPPATNTANQPAAAQESYIKKLILAVKDFVVMIFQKICSCFMRPAPAAPAAPTLTPEQERAQRVATLQRLGPIELWNRFQERFSTDEQKRFVYDQIGRTANVWFGSYENRGREMAHSNLRLLIPYLV